MTVRVYCVGYGIPCPAHAWWYAEHRPQGGGRQRKRCDYCHARRRWLEPDHAVTCLGCGAPLVQPETGRPRLRCASCSPMRQVPLFGALLASAGRSDGEGARPEHISGPLSRAVAGVLAKATTEGEG